MDFPVSADDSYYNYLKSIEDDQLSVDCPKYFYADPDEAAMYGKIWVADGVLLSDTAFEPEPISKSSSEGKFKGEAHKASKRWLG